MAASSFVLPSYLFSEIRHVWSVPDTGRLPGLGGIRARGQRHLILRYSRSGQAFQVQYMDQLIPRLVDPTYGPILERIQENQGIYEFVNPVFRLYVKLRNF